MKILFAASECVPFVKTGGLADVVGALPRELSKNEGMEIGVILPLYKSIGQSWRDQMKHVLYFYINLGWRRQYVGVQKLDYEGVTYFFIDNEQYFGRDYIYGMGNDEGERYAFFCRAVLEALPKIDFIPDVLHCNDWQTGMIPVLLNAQYKHLELFKDIRTIYTIHNLQYQGIFPIGHIEDLLSLGDWAYRNDKLEFYGMCSFMKAGIVFADEVTTVSPSYAQEIQTPYFGERLDGLLRARADRLTGILNGIDTIEYNPETDPLIARNYTADTFSLKAENKTALQQELGLTIDPSIPMIGLVSRLSDQKGLDLIERVLAEIMDTGAQLVILGMGDRKYVDLFGWAQWKYPQQVAARFQMDQVLAHKIYAAADMFLMPSLFEPCGLSQMISLRYGTLPITRETGGLRDTVLAYNEFTQEGNGFTFFNYNAHDMLYVIEHAIALYKENHEIFNKLAIRAMQGQYGWDQSANKYVELYEKQIAEGVIETQRALEEAKAAAKAKKKTSAKKAVEAVDTVVEPEIAAEPKKRTSRKKKEETPVEEAAEVKKPRIRKNAKAAETEESKEVKKPRTRKTAKAAEATSEESATIEASKKERKPRVSKRKTETEATETSES